jgi:hypothetical protein
MDMNLPKFWDDLISLVEEKLQFGLLTQMRSVVSAQIEGGEMMLAVNSREALDFFNNATNQQRFILLARPILPLEKISVSFVQTEN